MQEDPAVWDRVREEYGITTVYFSHTDGTPWANAFLARILSDDSWHLIYFDAKSVILSSGQEYAIDTIDEGSFAERYRELQAIGSESERMSLASLAGVAGYPELAAETYMRIIKDNPHGYRGYLGLAGLYSSSADQSYLRQAVVLYGKALERGFRLPLIYNRLGLVHWQLGEYALAKQDWEAAQRRNRKDEESSSYLLQLQDLQESGQLPANLY
jgi:tetratricopeptide (TPR) repeat protein